MQEIEWLKVIDALNKNKLLAAIFTRENLQNFVLRQYRVIPCSVDICIEISESN